MCVYDIYICVCVYIYTHTYADMHTYIQAQLEEWRKRPKDEGIMEAQEHMNTAELRLQEV